MMLAVGCPQGETAEEHVFRAGGGLGTTKQGHRFRIDDGKSGETAGKNWSRHVTYSPKQKRKSLLAAVAVRLFVWGGAGLGKVNAAKGLAAGRVVLAKGGSVGIAAAAAVAAALRADKTLNQVAVRERAALSSLPLLHGLAAGAAMGDRRTSNVVVQGLSSSSQRLAARLDGWTPLHVVAVCPVSAGPFLGQLCRVLGRMTLGRGMAQHVEVDVGDLPATFLRGAVEALGGGKKEGTVVRLTAGQLTAIVTPDVLGSSDSVECARESPGWRWLLSRGAREREALAEVVLQRCPLPAALLLASRLEWTRREAALALESASMMVELEASWYRGRDTSLWAAQCLSPGASSDGSSTVDANQSSRAGTPSSLEGGGPSSLPQVRRRRLRRKSFSP